MNVNTKKSENTKKGRGLSKSSILNQNNAKSRILPTRFFLNDISPFLKVLKIGEFIVQRS